MNTIKQSVPKYISITIDDNTICVFGTEKILVTLTNNNSHVLLDWLKQAEIKNNCKFIAADITGDKDFHPLISGLWLESDIVPYFISFKGEIVPELQSEVVCELRKRFSSENLVNINLSDLNEVEIAELVTLDDYKKISNPDEFALLINLAGQFKGKKMVFISATPQGGGVALMRHALIRLYRLLGVDAHWYVLYPSKEAFDITKKKFHNILQGVATEDTVLTAEDKKIYNDWIANNAAQLENVYIGADVVIVDDPQPSGLVPLIKKVNPKAKIIYRSHIQIESELAVIPNTPQNITWQFIKNNIKDVDLFVAHPIQQFIPTDIPADKIVLMPATTDALDGLNKSLSTFQTDYYLKWFNRLLVDINQQPLDRSRPYIIQIARFDPSKGIPDVIESYRLLVNLLKKTTTTLPQLVICGHGSIDDTESGSLYKSILEILKLEQYRKLASDIKVILLPPSDQMLNALLTHAKIALQLSHKEGFEVKISEALMKGIPVVAYDVGGIPLQVREGVSGYLIKVGETETVAEKLYNLFTDDNLYSVMSKKALMNINPETTTISNAVNWLFLATELLDKGKIEGNSKSIKNLISK
jgi:alpha,alpha-trehalose phosphorylase (configuration-retaining)